ncbi:hypothetical protein [Massilia oculi]|uniref:hypothetical protein n=1 Tax=Massilia oculi TaxID=945844 RepID=UPI001AAE909C|nr:hypothetical protein [Massilia oculi]
MEKTICENCGELAGSCACRRRFCSDFSGDEKLVFIEGHDDAILGLAEVGGEQRVVYDHGAVIRRLMRRDGMDLEGAEEFFNYNIAGSSAPLGAPILLWVDRS